MKPHGFTHEARKTCPDTVSPRDRPVAVPGSLTSLNDRAGRTPASRRRQTMTNEETEAWLAICKEAAKNIDPATAELHWEHGEISDPYGIKHLPDGFDCIGRNHFARAPGSDVWVSFHDLPEAVRDELRK